MMNTRNNKGFTLVELLAVIVILAVIMGIAIVSIGGILENAKKNTYKETAASIIGGVKQRLTMENELKEGDYLFTTALMEKGGTQSPYGAELNVAESLNVGTGGNCAGGQLIGDSSVCRVSGTAPTCSATSASYVRVTQSGTTYSFSICLTAGAGNKYIDVEDATETNLVDSSNNSMIK